MRSQMATIRNHAFFLYLYRNIVIHHHSSYDVSRMSLCVLRALNFVASVIK